MAVEKEGQHSEKAGQYPCADNDTVALPEGHPMPAFIHEDKWENTNDTCKEGGKQ